MKAFRMVMYDVILLSLLIAGLYYNVLLAEVVGLTIVYALLILQTFCAFVLGRWGERSPGLVAIMIKYRIAWSSQPAYRWYQHTTDLIYMTMFFVAGAYVTSALYATGVLSWRSVMLFKRLPDEHEDSVVE